MPHGSESSEPEEVTEMTASTISGHTADATRPGPGRAGLRQSLTPLILDAAVPVGGYYLLRDGLGLSVWLSLALSGIVPAVHAIVGLVAQRRLNLLAVLMVVVDIAGIVVSFATGDPRLMIAKESVISSVIALAILGSVALGRPLMSAGLRPFLTRGDADRIAAWDRLSGGNVRFRRLERLFSLIWGVLLLVDCVARVVGAFTLPVATMVWLSTVITLAAVGAGCAIGGVAANPLDAMIDTATGQPGRHQQRR